MGAAVEEKKNPAEEEDKNPAGEEDKNSAEKEDNNPPGQVLLSKAEKTHLSVDAEEPHLPSRNEPAPERRRNTDHTAEARQYLAVYASVPEDVRLPDGWHLKPNRVPVPPPLRGPTRIQEIHRRRVDLPPELRADPLYGVNSPEWDRIFEAEHEIRRHSFFAASPPASWFDSDDELLFDDDDPDAAMTDADLYVRQLGEVGYVPPPADVPMEEGKPVVDNEA